MKRARIVLILLLSMVFCEKALFLGFCAEEYKVLDVNTKIVKGTVTGVSQIEQKITIQEEGKDKETTFAITERTKVLKNNVRGSYSDNTSDLYVSLDEIMEGDEAIVEYYDNPKVSGDLAAKSIELIKK